MIDLKAALRARFEERRKPGLGAMAKNAAAAALAAANNPSPVSAEERARRLAICDTCSFFIRQSGRCAKCGCRLNWKSRLAAWHCPIGQW